MNSELAEKIVADIWSIFNKYGLTYTQAFILWQLIGNEIERQLKGKE